VPRLPLLPAEPEDDIVAEVFRLASQEWEYCQIEKLDLDALPQPFGFQVLALPVSIERASCAWARVVALCDEP
jgi:cyclase